MREGFALGQPLERRKDWRETRVYERKEGESFFELLRVAGFEGGKGFAVTNPLTGEKTVHVKKDDRMLSIEIQERRKGRKVVVAREFRRI